MLLFGIWVGKLEFWVGRSYFFFFRCVGFRVGGVLFGGLGFLGSVSGDWK